jgi:hypothetical protein
MICMAGVFLLFACNAPSSPNFGFCLAPRSIALEVVVTDSVSSAGIGDSATGTVTTATYQDSLHHFTPDTLWGGDQLGSYTITVRRPGYADWSQADVVVSNTGPCGNVIPVQLAARLVSAR